jgi:hypothetical protein
VVLFAQEVSRSVGCLGSSLVKSLGLCVRVWLGWCVYWWVLLRQAVGSGRIGRVGSIVAIVGTVGISVGKRVTVCVVS